MRYFTADFHLGDNLLIEKGLRQFKSGSRMADVFIKNANMRAKEDDTLIHVGDFVCYGADRGIEGSRISGREYLQLINANVILLEGNHDANNHVKPHGKILITDIGPFKNVSVAHYPSWFKQLDGLIPNKTCFHICGHVHGDWKVRKASNGIININVGVDVWKYQIVSESDIIELFEKIRKEK